MDYYIVDDSKRSRIRRSLAATIPILIIATFCFAYELVQAPQATNQPGETALKQPQTNIREQALIAAPSDLTPLANLNVATADSEPQQISSIKAAGISSSTVTASPQSATQLVTDAPIDTSSTSISTVLPGITTNTKIKPLQTSIKSNHLLNLNLLR